MPHPPASAVAPGKEAEPADAIKRVAFRTVLRIGRGTTRAVVAAAALATIALGGYSAMLQLLTLVLLLAAALMAEAARPERVARPARVGPA